MRREMSRFGVGPFFALASFVFGITVFWLNYVYFPRLFVHNALLIYFGTTLIILGAVLFVAGAVQLHLNFHKGKLETRGVYAIVRHPIYASWIVCIIPGLVLALGSVLGVAIPLFMYLAFRILIVKEERYLEKRYGEEYRGYRKRVGMVFPRF